MKPKLESPLRINKKNGIKLKNLKIKHKLKNLKTKHHRKKNHREKFANNEQQCYSIDRTRLHDCFFCSFKCYYSRFVKHLKQHTFECPFLCTQCGKNFSDKQTLLQHVLGHIQGKPYKCRSCKRCFKRRETVLIHVQKSCTSHKTTIKEKLSKCRRKMPSKLNVTYPQKKNLAKENSNQLDNKLKELRVILKPLDRRSFALNTNLDTQLDNKLKELRVILKPLDRRSFALNTNLDKPYSSTKEPKDKNEIYNELNILTEEDLISRDKESVDHSNNKKICDEVNIITKENFLRRKNIRFKRQLCYSTDSDNLYSCPECGLKFNYYDLKDHLMDHTFKSPLGCTLCSGNHQYSSKLSLVRHILGHLKVSFVCHQSINQYYRRLAPRSVCHIGDKSFGTESTTISHIKQVYDLDICECNTCRAQFHSVSSLKNHKKICSLRNQFEDKTYKHLGSTQLAFEPEDSSSSQQLIISNTKPYQQLKDEMLVELDKSTVDECKNSKMEIGNNFRKAVADCISVKSHQLYFSIDVTQMHSCPLCNLKFDYYNLEEHLANHTFTEPLQCKLCKQRATTNTHLIIHLLTHIDGKSIKCLLCGTFCKTEKCIFVHMMRRHNKKIWRCNGCRAQFCSVLSFKKHRKKCVIKDKQCEPSSATKDKGISKKKCIVINDLHAEVKHNHSIDNKNRNEERENFNVAISNQNVAGLNDRYYSVDTTYLHRCPLCNLKFDYYSLQEHFTNHTITELRKCEHCKKQMSKGSRFLLIRHLFSHIDKKSIKCLLCGSFHKYLEILYSHMFRIHKKRIRECNGCRAQFCDVLTLKKHKIKCSLLKDKRYEPCSAAKGKEIFQRKYIVDDIENNGSINLDKETSKRKHVEINTLEAEIEKNSRINLDNETSKRKCVEIDSSDPEIDPNNSRNLDKVTSKVRYIEFDNLDTEIELNSNINLDKETSKRNYIEEADENNHMHHIENNHSVAAQNYSTKKLQQPYYSIDTTRMHLCFYCEFKFNYSELQEHLLNHTSTRPFQCMQCKKKFPNKHRLIAHLMIHLKGKSLKCLKCGMFTRNKISMINHIWSYHKTKFRECTACKAQFCSALSVKRHKENCRQLKVKQSSKSLKIKDIKTHNETDTACKNNYKQENTRTKEISVNNDMYVQVTIADSDNHNTKINENSIIKCLSVHSTTTDSNKHGNNRKKKTSFSKDMIFHPTTVDSDKFGNVKTIKTRVNEGINVHPSSTDLDGNGNTQTEEICVMKDINVHQTTTDTDNQRNSRNEEACVNEGINFNHSTTDSDKNGNTETKHIIIKKDINVHSLPVTLDKQRNTKSKDIIEGKDINAHPSTINLYKEDIKSKEGIGTKNISVHPIILDYCSTDSFVCAECGNGYNKRSKFFQHTFDHIDKAPFVCLLCDKIFNRKETLRSHLSLHFNIKIIECIKCKAEFSSSKDLEAHKQICAGKFINCLNEEVAENLNNTLKDKCVEKLSNKNTNNYCTPIIPQSYNEDHDISISEIITEFEDNDDDNAKIIPQSYNEEQSNSIRDIGIEIEDRNDYPDSVILPNVGEKVLSVTDKTTPTLKLCPVSSPTSADHRKSLKEKVPLYSNALKASPYIFNTDSINKQSLILGKSVNESHFITDTSMCTGDHSSKDMTLSEKSPTSLISTNSISFSHPPHLHKVSHNTLIPVQDYGLLNDIDYKKKKVIYLNNKPISNKEIPLKNLDADESQSINISEKTLTVSPCLPLLPIEFIFSTLGDNNQYIKRFYELSLIHPPMTKVLINRDWILKGKKEEFVLALQYEKFIVQQWFENP